MENSIQILGNNIDCFESYHSLYEACIKLFQKKVAKGYVTVNNVHTMMEGYKNPHYQKIINEGFLAIPDGMPLVISGRLKGNKKISRLFGPTVMELFIDWGRKDNLSHFFFGSTEETLAKLKEQINSKYPGAKISGMISPPFKPIEYWDSEPFLDLINKSKPDFIWIGLGAPKQEKWMYDNLQNLNSGIMFGIGAGFDYLAGNTKHAPQWMKKSSLEWLYRLIQEPKRLWKRYLFTIPPFIILSFIEIIKEKFKKTNKAQI